MKIKPLEALAILTAIVTILLLIFTDVTDGARPYWEGEVMRAGK